MKTSRRRLLIASAGAASVATLAGCGAPEEGEAPTPPAEIHDSDPATVYLMESMRYQNGLITQDDPDIDKPEMDFNQSEYNSDWQYILESVKFQNDNIQASE